MLKIFIYLFFITSLITESNAESISSKNTEHQYNFYVGNFDFSDDKQSAVFFGIQHQHTETKNIRKNLKNIFKFKLSKNM